MWCHTSCPLQAHEHNSPCNTKYLSLCCMNWEHVSGCVHIPGLVLKQADEQSGCLPKLLFIGVVARLRGLDKITCTFYCRIGWWLSTQIYGLLLGSVQSNYSSFWFKPTGLLHVHLQNYWALLSSCVFCPVFLWQIDTRVDKIRQHRKCMAITVNLQLEMLDIMFLLMTHSWQSLHSWQQLEMLDVNVSWLLLEVSRSYFVLVHSGQDSVHAVTAILWLESQLHETNLFIHVIATAKTRAMLCNVHLVLYHSLKHTPRAISHVKHDTTTLSALKYLPLVLDLDSLNFQVPSDRRITQLSVTAGHRLQPSSSVSKCFSGNQKSHDWFFELIWSIEAIKFCVCMPLWPPF